MSAAKIAWNTMREKYGKGLLTWEMLPPVYKEAFELGVNAAVLHDREHRDRRRQEIATAIAEAEARGAYEAVEHASGDNPGLDVPTSRATILRGLAKDPEVDHIFDLQPGQNVQAVLDYKPRPDMFILVAATPEQCADIEKHYKHLNQIAVLDGPALDRGELYRLYPPTFKG